MSGGQGEAAEEIDDGGPAFSNPTTCATDGTALRDWLQGRFWNNADESELAAGAYEHANAMLQQRKAKPCTKDQ